MKFITHEAEGAGHCADEWSIKRLQYKACNNKRCETLAAPEPLTCNKTLDIILLIDGSGSLGKAGWDADRSSKGVRWSLQDGRKIQFCCDFIQWPEDMEWCIQVHG